MTAVLAKKLERLAGRRDGMELVQVAILVAIAVALGLIFKTQIIIVVMDIISHTL